MTMAMMMLIPAAAAAAAAVVVVVVAAAAAAALQVEIQLQVEIERACAHRHAHSRPCSCYQVICFTCMGCENPQTQTDRLANIPTYTLTNLIEQMFKENFQSDLLAQYSTFSGQREKTA